MRLGEQAHHVGVGLQDVPPGARARLAHLRPVLGRLGEHEVAHHPIADPLEKIVLVLHVVVQRHRFDADLACHASHRHRLEPLGVHHEESGVDDAVAGQTFAWLRGSHVSSAVLMVGVDRLTAYA